MRAGAKWTSLRFAFLVGLEYERGVMRAPRRRLWEESMTRFQRIALLTAACGVVALAIPYFIVVLLR